MFFFTLSIEKKPLSGGFSGFFYFAGANIIHPRAKSKYTLTLFHLLSQTPVFPIDAKRETPAEHYSQKGTQATRP